MKKQERDNSYKSNTLLPSEENILFGRTGRYYELKPLEFPKEAGGFLLTALHWKGTPYSLVLLNIWTILEKWQAIIAVPIGLLSIVTIILHIVHFHRRENERSQMRRLRIKEKENELREGA